MAHDRLGQAAAIAELARLVQSDTRNFGHPARVAVDGITASGKTMIANQLAAAIAMTGHDVHRLTMDDFHHPRSRRYRRGRASADGYYLDGYDLDSFGWEVLHRLAPDGDSTYRPAILDLASDQPVHPSPRRIERGDTSWSTAPSSNGLKSSTYWI